MLTLMSRHGREGKMPNQAKKYTVLYVPNSGLFFEGGEFVDGRRERIEWNRTIPVYESHMRAQTARDKILESWPDRYADGNLVVLGVEFQEREFAHADENPTRR